MNGRTARINAVHVVSAGLSAIINFGDAVSFTPKVRALAVQRELDHLTAGEVYFTAYPLFYRRPPDSKGLPAGFDQPPAGVSFKQQGDICVGFVHVVAITASAMLQAGNTGTVAAESRIKHFRQFAHRPVGDR